MTDQKIRAVVFCPNGAIIFKRIHYIEYSLQQNWISITTTKGTFNYSQVPFQVFTMPPPKQP